MLEFGSVCITFPNNVHGYTHGCFHRRDIINLPSNAFAQQQQQLSTNDHSEYPYTLYIFRLRCYPCPILCGWQMIKIKTYPIIHIQHLKTYWSDYGYTIRNRVATNVSFFHNSTLEFIITLSEAVSEPVMSDHSEMKSINQQNHQDLVLI